MPISTTVSSSVGTERGFTLIEVLIVVVLIGLFAALLVPNMIVGNERDLDQGALRLQDVLASVGEHSVFSGELLGVRLEEDRVVPMRFDPVEQKFVVFGGQSRVGLDTWRLDEDLRLAWDLGNPEEDAADSHGGVTIAQAAEARLIAGEDEDDRDKRPQLFFFPSGEATPARLSLELIGSRRMPVVLNLSAFSRVTIEDDTL
ncbi:prepilin-type N-terminal cleavage/methylation domain-containing protein [Alcanivorax sp. JB21]|uniref:prepilin-type N-terminal cleavage/methylation domain-containing protein n=1 Tax=Alcanivorax limicola TaxID=2874102 RepID=UPI001CBCFB8B|nr:prepilin-type N-terminal cleavage/methylation domain-containing protein [Alcanivorax limicola]MBZ2187859.1 prepilin-type N-terminal cleavage/methylation domain-containing protein [Alcanivorax limicola]